MRKDFEEYFTKMQLDYNKMLKAREDVNEQISKGLVTDDQRRAFENYFNQVKSNYDRTYYMWYLLHLPPKFIRVIEQKFVNSKIKKELDKLSELKADKESVSKENEEALSAAEEELRKCKNS